MSSSRSASSILFCTDFSLRSKFALLSAAYLANIFNRQLVICHIHDSSKKDLTSSLVIDRDVLNKKHAMQKEFLHRSLKNLGELEIWIRRIYKTIETSTEFVESNDISSSISQISEKRNAFLVTFSTRVRQNGSIYVGGKTISSIKVQCPILIFPISDDWLGKELEDWSWTLQQIVYTTGSSKDGGIRYPTELDSMAQWKEIGGDDVKLTVLHVIPEGSESQLALHSLESQFSHVDDWIIRYGDNISDTILNYTRDESTSLLVLGQRRRGFFGSLFHKSALKTISNSTTIPVLIFNH